ncbi:MAG TPA: serine/threonine-protein kinase [Ktedonobacteraceae bacterium]
MENDSIIGKQLGAYHIQSKLGEGGMARVYKAYHARLRRDVAIKVILSQIADQTGFKARFEREAQLIASLEHPNIVAVYDFGELGNLTYLVMQFVGGGTLRDQLHGGYALDPGRAILYAQQMARALHHAHQRGIVHRDVKPQNMLVSASDPNHLLLSDFGIARLFNNPQESSVPNPADASGTMRNDPTMTNSNQIVGTAEYMSPEQINGKAVDARTDVYALGVVLFQMLTGEVPFHSTTIPGLLYQHVYIAPRPVREVKPYVPEILAQIVAKAMEKAPEDRFQSAEAMAQALEVAYHHVTRQLSTPSGPISATYNPPVGDFSHPMPAQNRLPIGPNSYYGQPSNPAIKNSEVAPNVPQSLYGATPSFDINNRAIHSTGGSAAISSLPERTRLFRPGYLAISLFLLLLAAGLIIWRTGLIIPPVNPTATSKAFTEDFHNNDRNWTIGGLDNGNFAASMTGSKYTLTVGNISNTYFPHPDTSAVGTLPGNFTLTARMEQTGGTSTNVFYGIAFHLSENGAKVYCYALVLDSFGDYQLLKYNADISNTPTKLWSGQLSAFTNGIDHFHSLQAKVQGSSFSFTIDGKAVAVGAQQVTSYTDSSNTYTGGELALMVTGPSTAFMVSSVQLTIP